MNCRYINMFGQCKYCPMKLEKHCDKELDTVNDSIKVEAKPSGDGFIMFTYKQK